MLLLRINIETAITHISASLQNAGDNSFFCVRTYAAFSLHYTFWQFTYTTVFAMVYTPVRTYAVFSLHYTFWQFTYTTVSAMVYTPVRTYAAFSLLYTLCRTHGTQKIGLIPQTFFILHYKQLFSTSNKRKKNSTIQTADHCGEMTSVFCVPCVLTRRT